MAAAASVHAHGHPWVELAGYRITIDPTAAIGCRQRRQQPPPQYTRRGMLGYPASALWASTSRSISAMKRSSCSFTCEDQEGMFPGYGLEVHLSVPNQQLH